MKRYKSFIIVGCIIAILGIVLLCASGIVKHSYSSEGYVADKESSNEREISAPSAVDDFKMEYSGSSDGPLDKVSQMYNSDRVDGDLDRFLEEYEYSEEDIKDFKSFVSDIEENSSSYFGELSERQQGKSYELKYYSIDEYPELTAKELISGSEYSIIKNSLVVVGLFEGNRVLYSYGFPDSGLYICVDYSGTDFISGSTEVWKIGDIKEVAIVSENSTYQDMGTYQIIYTKG